MKTASAATVSRSAALVPALLLALLAVCLNFPASGQPSPTDTDGDALSDHDEQFIWGTDPLNPDTDSDGMWDGWEVSHGLNPRANDANEDRDLDGVTNLQEYRRSLGSNCIDAPPGLLAYWAANGTARDSVGANKGIPTNGAAFVAGKVGQAFSLDGTNDYIQIGPNEALRVSTRISIGAWIFPTGPGSDSRDGGIILSKEGEYEVGRAPDGTIWWALANSNPGWRGIYTAIIAPQNTWTHLALVYDGTVVNVFANGTLGDARGATGGIGDANTSLNDFRIGGRQEGPQFFAGLVDEVVLYNRALSATEVQTLYSAGLSGRSPFPSCGESDSAKARQNTRYYYDRKDRLVGAELGRGFFVRYEYDGNDNLVRQVYSAPDANTNGLPDLWEWVSGLTNNASAYADSDGDGWTDWQEWKAGTNPLDPNSRPDRPTGSQTTIATLQLPFIPTNFVMAAGQLDGIGAEEIVVGADGKPNGATNTLFILTQQAVGWSTQRVEVGSCGITSIAIGQPTNRPAPAIYLGLRQPGSNGWVAELSRVAGAWQMPTNAIATSADEVAFVLGIRNTGDLLVNCSADGLDAALFSLVYSTNGTWNRSVVSTNASHRGLGTHGLLMSRTWRDASMRLLDKGGIETVAGNLEIYVSDFQIPTNSIYNPASQKWYFPTPVGTWGEAQGYCASFHGNLVTIWNGNENWWVRTNFPGNIWIGLYHTPEGVEGWASGLSSPLRNWLPYPEYRLDWQVGLLTQTYGAYMESSVPPALFGQWYAQPQSQTRPGVGDASGTTAIYTNRWLLPEQVPTNRAAACSGRSLMTGQFRPDPTNSSSILYASLDDANTNGLLDADDQFVFVEYILQDNSWTTSTLDRLSLGEGTLHPSVSLAVANLQPFQPKLVFTAEPTGCVYVWQATNASEPLERRLFNADYEGKSWRALEAVEISPVGEGLAGLMVNPTNPSICNLIFWPPQTEQPRIVTAPQTTPVAIVIPSANPLGSIAAVTVRLWDAEGNASTPFLQYSNVSMPGWSNATILTVDRADWYPSLRVSALPTGSDHALVWNALADFGTNSVTNVWLRARAQDFSLTGVWSAATEFPINLADDGDGIPDWWELQFFGSTARNGAGDSDGDGLSDRMEYLADTNPTNAASVLRITSIQLVPGGVWMEWQGGILATQYLQRAVSLDASNVWTDLIINAPPTPPSGSFTDGLGTNAMQFYRIRAAR